MHLYEDRYKEQNSELWHLQVDMEKKEKVFITDHCNLFAVLRNIRSINIVFYYTTSMTSIELSLGKIQNSNTLLHRS